MKKIVSYFRDFHASYFNLRMYLTSAAFIALLIILNYTFMIEDSYIDNLPEAWRVLGFFFYHGIAWFGALLIIRLGRKDKTKIPPSFWIKGILGFLILGVDRSFYSYYKIIFAWFPAETAYFYYKLGVNSAGLVFILLPLLIIKLLFDRKKGDGLYGLTLRKLDWKPYWIMLLIMTPLIYLASLTPDFISYYPTYKRVHGLEFAQFYKIAEHWAKVIYEVFYISDFTFTELFFRGFLVIGFINILGKDAIIPMAATYAVLHFGKPLAETISSVSEDTFSVLLPFTAVTSGVESSCTGELLC